MPTRRRFLRTVAAPALIGLTAKAEKRIDGQFVNDGFPLGHRLREHASFSTPKTTKKIPIVIVGGGIAGLSAAWRLHKKGFRDFVILEMEPEPGGNSAGERTKSPPIPGPPTMCLSQGLMKL